MREDAVKMDFSTKEKEAAFDRIASCFYEQNFSTLGKSDFELMMFHIYMQHLKDTNSSYDDYSVSKALGITQQRVRSLKIKQQLRYGQTEDWKVELAKTALNHPHYSDDEKYITLSFDNPIIMIETQHFIEENGGFVDFSFNPKLLKMKTNDFACLMVEVGLSKDEKEVMKTIRSLYQEEERGDTAITKESFILRLKKGGIEFAKSIIEGVITNIISNNLAGL